ncbi:MAG: CapA family protein [Myxococcota bacterium]|nr:CapA family protein [Myxococcota bacterium]
MHCFPAILRGCSLLLGLLLPADALSATRILFAGDTHFGENYQEGASENILVSEGYQYTIQNFAAFLREADAVIANLETPITDLEESPFDKSYLHYADPTLTPLHLSSNNISVVSLANNHSLDFGVDGFVQTLAVLQAEGLSSFGAGLDKRGAARPYVRQFQVGARTFTLGVIGAFEYRRNYDEDYRFYADDTTPGAYMLSASEIGAQIAALRLEYPGIFLVAFPHWGSNYRWKTAAQTEMAHDLVDAGVDMVIGHGAHMIQEVEKYRGRWIAYSLGNLVFNSKGRYADFDAPPYGFILELVLEDGGNSLDAGFRLYPIFTNNRITNFQSRYVTQSEFDEVRALLLARGGTGSWDDEYVVGQGTSAGPYLGFPLGIPETVSGTVTAQQGGAPLADIDLDVFDLAGDKIDSATALTDALGRYTMTLPGPGDYILRADADRDRRLVDQYYPGVLLESDAAPITVEPGEAVVGIDLELPPGVLVSGRVTSSGTPVPDIDIDVFADNGERLTGKPGSSDADGQYAVGALPPGDYFVRTDPKLGDGQYFVRTFFESASSLGDATAVEVGATDATGIDIDMPAGGSIAGLVTEAGTGQPLEDIDIDVFETGGRQLAVDAESSADGSYEIGVLPPGSYLVRADPDASDGFAITYFDDAIGRLTATPVVVSAGGPTPGIDIALEASGSISGSIVATIGGAVAGMDLDLYEATTDDRLPQGDRSASDGSFRIDQLKTGSYKLLADPTLEDGLAQRYYDGEPNLASADAIAVTAGTETSGIVLVLEPGATISGRVTDATGTQPVEDADVVLVQAGTLVPFDQADRTDAEGRFTLFAIEAGDYLVRADPPAGEPFGTTWFGDASEPQAAAVIPVATGAEVTDVDIALPEPGAGQLGVLSVLSVAGLARAARRWRSAA